MLGIGGSHDTRLNSQGLVGATCAGGGSQGPAGSCEFDVMPSHPMRLLTSPPHSSPSLRLGNDDMALAANRGAV